MRRGAGDPRGGPTSRRVITASEIGEYGYCSRAWWYRHVVKLPAPGEGQNRLAEGTSMHRRHGEWVARSVQLRTFGILLALVGAAAIILALAIGGLK